MDRQLFHRRQGQEQPAADVLQCADHDMVRQCSGCRRTTCRVGQTQKACGEEKRKKIRQEIKKEGGEKEGRQEGAEEDQKDSCEETIGQERGQEKDVEEKDCEEGIEEKDHQESIDNSQEIEGQTRAVSMRAPKRGQRGF